MVHGPRFSLVVSRFQDLLPSGLREAMAVFFATSTTKVSATLLRVVQASLGVFSRKFSFRMENKRKTSEEKHFDDFIKRVRIARLSVPICGNHIVRQRDRRRQHLGMHSIRSHQHFSTCLCTCYRLAWPAASAITKCQIYLSSVSR